MSIKSVKKSNHLILCHLLFLLPSIFHGIQGLFQWVSSWHQVARELEFQIQNQFFQWIFRANFLYGWLVWSPYSLRDSQVSSPTPQFKSTNYSVHLFFHGPSLTPIHDYWKIHSFDYMDLKLAKKILSKLVFLSIKKWKRLNFYTLMLPAWTVQKNYFN